MTAAHATARLAAPEILTPGQIARTVHGVLAAQRPDGAIPWFHGDKLDPWDHTEAAMALDAAGQHTAAERAYRWLAARQNADGSWFANYADAPDAVTVPCDTTRDTNFSAYIAVGVYHHYLSTGDGAFLARMWPSVCAAIDFVLGSQRSDGTISWHPGADEALLTGCSSMYQALRCALAAAAALGETQPGWELAAAQLGHALVAHPERFAPKERYSMDWYYPVLGTALRGPEAHRRIDRDWERFVSPGYGVRCVDDRPWVTGGETAELAMALWALGREAEAAKVLAEMSAWLRDADGMYWTGYVYADDALWPLEKTAWTAGAVLLALAALGGDPATATVFGGERLPAVLTLDCAGERCAAGLR